MGYIKHEVLIVTGGLEHVTDAWIKASKILEKEFDEDDGFDGLDILGDITPVLMNGYCSFTLFPCGSKKGWELDQYHQNALDKFVKWINKKDRGVDFVRVQFGGDDNRSEIVD